MKKREIGFRRAFSNYTYSLKLSAKGSPGRFIYSFLFTFIQSILGFFSTEYMLRFVVNGIQEERSYKSIVLYLIMIMLMNVFVFGVIEQIYNNLIEPRWSRSLNVYVNKLIYRKSVEVDIENYENPEFYAKYNKAIGNSAICIEWTLWTVRSTISFIVQLFANTVLLIAIDPVLMLFALFPLVFSFVRKKCSKLRYESEMKSSEANRCKDYTRRSFYLSDYAKEMRLTNIYKVMLRRFRDSIAEVVRIARTDGIKIAMYDILLDLGLDVITILGAESYALFRTLVSETMLYGDCLIVLNSIGTVSYRIQYVNRIINCFYSIALYIEDYRAFADTKPKISPNENGMIPTHGDIELKDVSFCYDGSDRDTLKNINMKIKKGERIALVGHNGAGKTTLVKLLMRLYDPTSGEISLADRDIREYRLRDYRRMYGVVFQDYKQLSLSVAENVLGRSLSEGDEEKVVDSLKKAGVYDKISELPRGIHTTMTKEFDEYGVVLSGGQSQKIAIASIYANDSSIVILDEPSSALDPLAEHELYENMMTACAGRTIIFISHRLSSAVSADRIFLLDGGEIKETGTHRELMDKNGIYATMFKAQAENYVD